MARECHPIFRRRSIHADHKFLYTPRVQLKTPLENIPIRSFSDTGAKRGRKKRFSWLSLRHMSRIGSVERKQHL